MIAENISWQKLTEDGFDKAFDILFRNYFEKLCRFAKEYVIDHEISKELVQDTFLKLWEIKESLGSDANYKALLYTITRNNALNHLKHEIVKKKYRHNNCIHSKLELNYIALTDTTIEALIANDLNIHIKKIINELPEKCRTAFILSRDNGLSYKDIAIKMSISTNTVENHISEALKKIRNGLAGII